MQMDSVVPKMKRGNTCI